MHKFSTFKSKLKRVGCLLLILSTTQISQAAETAQSKIYAKHVASANQPITVYSTQEKELGEYWLKAFRGSVRTIDDPLVDQYIKELVGSLAKHNSNNFGDISLVIVDSPDINAFAVPGSVMGVNLGIFRAAGSEGQLASILSHELAHLSQRHFARSMKEQESQRLPIYAGLLLGAILAAAGSGDGATAALAGSQAAAAQAQLRFSRQYEQEADRVGIENLYDAGYSKTEMINMFETLNTQLGTRFGGAPPEYLLTHPLPASRINEIRQRIVGDKRAQPTKDSLRFHLIKVLSEIYYGRNNAAMSKSYKAQLSRIKAAKNSQQYQILRFGLASALKEENQFNDSAQILTGLISQNPAELAYHYELLDTYIKQGNYKAGYAHIQKYSSLRSNYTIAVPEIKILRGLERYADAQQLLFQQIQKDDERPLLWYLLAENSGQMQDIAQLHEARAQYFILYNRFEKAKVQLNYALTDKRAKLSPARRAAVVSKIAWIDKTQKRKADLGF